MTRPGYIELHACPHCGTTMRLIVLTVGYAADCPDCGHWYPLDRESARRYIDGTFQAADR